MTAVIDALVPAPIHAFINALTRAQGLAAGTERRATKNRFGLHRSGFLLK